ncbi:MAG: hypothetical protein AB7O95_27860 [Geminicoccaceae bacterium]
MSDHPWPAPAGLPGGIRNPTTSAAVVGARPGTLHPQSGIDVNENVDRLLQSLDDIRGGVAPLRARSGDEAAAVGHRGVRQAREVAGGSAEDLARRAGEGTAALCSRVEEQTVTGRALAFFAGPAVAGVLMGALARAGEAVRIAERGGLATPRGPIRWRGPCPCRASPAGTEAVVAGG